MTLLSVTLLLFVANGGTRLFIPFATNGLEWLGAADVTTAECRVVIKTRTSLAGHPDQWNLGATQNEEYDDGGRILSRTMIPAIESARTVVTFYQYLFGLLIRAYGHPDNYEDGRVKSGVLVYNSDSLLIRMTQLENDRPVSSQSFFYRSDGKLARQDTDRNGDDVVDERITREYSEDGTLIGDREEYFDRDFPSAKYSYVYEHGLVVSSDLLREHNGNVTYRAGARYSYNSQGAISTDFSWAEDSSGRREALTTYDYDDRGNLIYYLIDEITRQHHSSVRYVYDERKFLLESMSTNYLGGVGNTQYLYENCTKPMKHVRATIFTARVLVDQP